MTPFNLLTVEDYAQREAARQRTSAFRRDTYAPGTAWMMPWIYNPAKPDPDKIERGLAGRSFLSVYYWRDWAHVRPPICVVCPDGNEWIMDQRSNNGLGWTISGTPDCPTAMPSIVVGQYHGWLRDGFFSPDLEGRVYGSRTSDE